MHYLETSVQTPPPPLRSNARSRAHLPQKTVAGHGNVTHTISCSSRQRCPAPQFPLLTSQQSTHKPSGAAGPTRQHWFGHFGDPSGRMHGSERKGENERITLQDGERQAGIFDGPGNKRVSARVPRGRT